ncbi:MAG: class I SAM-dependent methyltransferase [Aquificae bacterium]|nr:class I SAM-dependent methyltransferase [Aquificota bacterium]
MAKTEPFDLYADDYERWFEKNDKLYLSEVGLLRSLVGDFKKGFEVGIGTGRFALPLGIKRGVDPSWSMLKLALSRGLEVVRGVAEALPLKDESVDLALMVTTICFVDDPVRSLKEVDRILVPKGRFVLGFVDKNSFLGKLYERKKPKSKFYGPATFYSVDEVLKLAAEHTSLRPTKVLQTIFGTENRLYPIKEGFGEGAFVGILFEKGGKLQ